MVFYPSIIIVLMYMTFAIDSQIQYCGESVNLTISGQSVQICKSCLPDFVNVSNKCVSKCPENQFLSDQNCEMTCKIGSLEDQETMTCQKFNICPRIHQVGSSLFPTGIKKIVSINKNEETNLFMIGNKDLSIIQLILTQNKYRIGAVWKQHVDPIEEISVYQNQFFSFSSTQFIIWDLDTGLPIIQKKNNYGRLIHSSVDSEDRIQDYLQGYQLSITDKSEFYIHDLFLYKAVKFEITGKTKAPQNVLSFDRKLFFILEGELYFSNYNMSKSIEIDPVQRVTNSDKFPKQIFPLNPEELQEAIWFFRILGKISSQNNDITICGIRDNIFQLISFDENGISTFKSKQLIISETNSDQIIDVILLESNLKDMYSTNYFVIYSKSSLKSYKIDIETLEIIISKTYHFEQNQVIQQAWYQPPYLIIKTTSHELKFLQSESLIQQKKLAETTYNDQQVTSVLLTQNYFLAFAQDIMIYDSQTLQKRNKITNFLSQKQAHSQPAFQMVFDQSSMVILSIAMHSELILWDHDTNFKLGAWYHPDFGISNYRASPDLKDIVVIQPGQYLSVYEDGSLVEWNLQFKQLVAKKMVKNLFLPSSDRLLIHPLDKSIFFVFNRTNINRINFETPAIEFSEQLYEENQFFQFMFIAPDDHAPFTHHLFTSSKQYNITKWSLDDLQIVKTILYQIELTFQWIPDPLPALEIFSFKFDERTGFILQSESYGGAIARNTNLDVLERAHSGTSAFMYESYYDCAIDLERKQMIIVSGWGQNTIYWFADNTTLVSNIYQMYYDLPNYFSKLKIDLDKNLLVTVANYGSGSTVMITKPDTGGYVEQFKFTQMIVDFHIDPISDQYIYILFNDGSLTRSYYVVKKPPFRVANQLTIPKTFLECSFFSNQSQGRCETVNQVPQSDMASLNQVFVFGEQNLALSMSNHVQLWDLITFKPINSQGFSGQDLIKSATLDSQQSSFILLGGTLEVVLTIWKYSDDSTKYLRHFDGENQVNVKQIYLGAITSVGQNDASKRILFVLTDNGLVFMWSYPNFQVQHRVDGMRETLSDGKHSSIKQIEYLDLTNNLVAHVILEGGKSKLKFQDVSSFTSIFEIPLTDVDSFVVDKNFNLIYAYGKDLHIIDTNKKTLIKTISGFPSVHIQNVKIYQDRVFFYDIQNIKALSRQDFSQVLSMNNIQSFGNIFPSEQSNQIITYMINGISFKQYDYNTGLQLYQYDGYLDFERAQTDLMVLDEESQILFTIDQNYFTNLRSSDVRDSSLRSVFNHIFSQLFYADFNFDSNMIVAIDTNENSVYFIDYQPYMGKVGSLTDLPLNQQTIFLYSDQAIYYYDEIGGIWVYDTNTEFLNYVTNLNTPLYNKGGIAHDSSIHIVYDSERIQVIKLDIYAMKITRLDSMNFQSETMLQIQDSELKDPIYISKMGPILNIISLNAAGKVSVDKTYTLDDHINQIIFNGFYRHLIVLKAHKISIVNLHNMVSQDSPGIDGTKLLTSTCYDSTRNLLFVSTSEKVFIYNYRMSQGCDFQEKAVISQTYGTITQLWVDSTNDLMLILTKANRALEIRKISDLSIIQQVIQPPSEFTKIIASEKASYFILYCSFQIMVYHSRSYQLIGRLRQHNTLGDITNIVIFKDIYVIAEAVESLWIFKIDISSPNLNMTVKSNNLIAINNFQLTNPKVLNFEVEDVQGSKILSIYGASIGKVFKYEFPQQRSERCWASFQNNNYPYELTESLKRLELSFNLMYMQSILKFVLIEIFIPESNRFLYIEEFQRPKFYKPFIQYRIEKIIDQDGNPQQKRILLQDEGTFAQLQVKNLVLEDIEFQLPEKPTNFIFSPLTFSVVFHNVILSSKNLKNIQISFINLEKANFESVSIANNNKQLRSLDGSIKSNLISYVTIENSNLLYFDGCQSVILNQVNFSGINLTSSSIFNFINNDKVVISNSSSSGCLLSNSSSLILAEANLLFQVKNSELLNFTLDNKNNQADSFVIVNQGSHTVLFDQLNVTYLQNVSFLRSKNEFLREKQKIILTNDIISILNSSFSYFNQTERKNNEIEKSISLMDIHASNLIISDSNFTNNNCSQCFGTCIFIEETNFQINNSNFFYNQGHKGGGLYLKQIDHKDKVNISLILNSNMSNNEAILEGGAIFSENSTFDIENTSFCDNSAVMGGGIKYLDSVPRFLYEKQSQNNSPKDYLSDSGLNLIQNLIELQSIRNITFANNIGRIMGNNIFSYPRSLVFDQETINQMKFEKEETEMIPSKDFVSFGVYSQSDFRSSAPINLSLQIIDEEGNHLRLTETIENLPPTIQKYLKQLTILFRIDSPSTISKSIINWDSFINTESVFQMKDMQVTSVPSSSEIIYISSSQVQIQNPEYNPQQPFIDIPGALSLLVNFRKCETGEIYQELNLISECRECTQGTYSLVYPNPQVKTQCLPCSTEVSSQCYQDKIFLKNGYWRLSNDTDLILNCFNRPENCEGEEPQSQLYCAKGKIGPLCETCDSVGRLWGSKYGQIGSFECSNCEESTSIVVVYFISAFLILVYILYSIYTTLTTSQRKIIVSYLRQMQLLHMSVSEQSGNGSLIGQSLLHYFQIISTLELNNFGFGFQIPLVINFLPSIIGDPILALHNSFDCSLKEDENLPVEYYKVVWSLMVPIIYVVCIGFLYVFLVQIQKISHNKGYIFNGMIFILLLMQPGVFSMLVRVISCREIGGVQYIMADVRHKCRTQSHNLYAISFIFPSLIIWGLAIPLILFVSIYKSQQQLDSIFVRLSFSFLYTDYKIIFFFWEFVKLALKIVINLAYNIVIDSSLKHLLILLSTFLYLFLTIRYKPFLVHFIHQIDILSHILIIILILLKQRALTLGDSLERALISSLILIVNYTYIVGLIWLTLSANKEYLQIQLQKLKKILKQQYPDLFKNLVIVDYLARQNKVYKNWQNCHYQFARAVYYQKMYDQSTFQLVQEENNYAQVQRYEDDSTFQRRTALEEMRVGIFYNITSNQTPALQGLLITKNKPNNLQNKEHKKFLDQEYKLNLDKQNEKYYSDEFDENEERKFQDVLKKPMINTSLQFTDLISKRNERDINDFNPSRSINSPSNEKFITTQRCKILASQQYQNQLFYQNY